MNILVTGIFMVNGNIIGNIGSGGIVSCIGGIDAGESVCDIWLYAL